MATLYYFPGYGGGEHSTTYNALLAEFPGIKVILYDNRNADIAFTQIREQLQDARPEDVFVGQSLGGFWAHYFGAVHRQKTVLINPSLRPFDSLAKYDFTESELESYRKVNKDVTLEKAPVILLSKDDNVVNPAPVLERYEGKARFVYVDGGHQFRHYDVLFAEIRKVLETPVSP